MSRVIEYKMERYTNTYQELKLYNEYLKMREGRGEERQGKLLCILTGCGDDSH